MMMMMMTGVETLETIELPKATLYWRSDKILKIVIKPKVNISLADSIQIFESMKKFSTGKKDMLVMTIAGEEATNDHEVREFSSSDECSRYTKGEAVVVHSLAHKLLINFALKFYKPNRPMRMFTNEEEAVDWLHSIK
jgi:hypothetical protein